MLKVKKLKKRHVCLKEIARYSHISKQHKNDKELPYGCSIKYYPTDLKKKKKKKALEMTIVLAVNINHQISDVIIVLFSFIIRYDEY